MMKSTLIFPVRGGVLRLAVKKNKVGAGLLNGWGGKLELEDGDPKTAALREFAEESGAQAQASYLDLRAVIRFFRAKEAVFECYIYFLWDWEGELRETPEMGGPEAFPLSNPPYEQMMPGDRLWFPIISHGERIRGVCCHSADNRKVEEFKYGLLI